MSAHDAATEMCIRKGPLPSHRAQDAVFAQIAARTSPWHTPDLLPPYDFDVVVKACARGFYAPFMVYHLVAAVLQGGPGTPATPAMQALRDFLAVIKDVDVDHDYLDRGPASSLVSGAHDPQTVLHLMTLLVEHGAKVHLNSNRMLAIVISAMGDFAAAPPTDSKDIHKVECLLRLERLVDPRTATVTNFIASKEFKDTDNHSPFILALLRKPGSSMQHMHLIGKLVRARCSFVVRNFALYSAFEGALKGPIGAKWKAKKQQADTDDCEHWFDAAIVAEKSVIGKAIAAYNT